MSACEFWCVLLLLINYTSISTLYKLLISIGVNCNSLLQSVSSFAFGCYDDYLCCATTPNSPHHAMPKAKAMMAHATALLAEL